MRSGTDVGWFANITCPPHPLRYGVVSISCSHDVGTKDLKSPASRNIWASYYHLRNLCVCVCHTLPLHDILRTATACPENATGHVYRMCCWFVMDMTLYKKKLVHDVCYPYVHHPSNHTRYHLIVSTAVYICIQIHTYIHTLQYITLHYNTIHYNTIHTYTHIYILNDSKPHVMGTFAHLMVHQRQININR